MKHLKNLPNTLNQYFPDDQCMMLQNYALVKGPFQAQDRLVDFNVNEQK